MLLVDGTAGVGMGGLPVSLGLWNALVTERVPKELAGGQFVAVDFESMAEVLGRGADPASVS
jgi:hypothetical protein